MKRCERCGTWRRAGTCKGRQQEQCKRRAAARAPLGDWYARKARENAARREVRERAERQAAPMAEPWP